MKKRTVQKIVNQRTEFRQVQKKDHVADVFTLFICIFATGIRLDCDGVAVYSTLMISCLQEARLCLREARACLQKRER
ncbi:MAG: hypothetical protein II612_02915 [Prevotella sp.]|nr:hypothetical protein [Prevotella sp.]